MEMFPHKIIGPGVMLIHKDPLHDIKVGTWCAMNAKLIIGPLFYSETIKF
jgi:hypothetical protein